MITFNMPTTRWCAFATHIGFSLLIFVAIVAVITLLWFPAPFMSAGGWQGIKIAFAVDMILGPLLTLVVYDTSKKSLKRDLAIIGMLQLSCLAAGVLQIHGQRPVLQVLSDQGITLITYDQWQTLHPKDTMLTTLPGSYPKAVYIELPEDALAIASLHVTSEFTQGMELEHRADLYLPLADIPETSWRWLMDTFATKQEDGCYWLHLNSSHASGQVCVDTGGAQELRNAPSPAVTTAD